MSSISSLASSSHARVAAYANRSHQRQQDMTALSDALNQDNITAAQDAFKQLVKDSPGLARMINKGTGKAASSQGTPGNFTELGDALEAGDLKTAKKAFQSIQQPQHRQVPASASTATQVLGMGIESVGASSQSQTTGSVLNTQA